MSAIGQPRRRGDFTPDDPMLRRIEEALTGTHLDAMYRRRLRGRVMNRYVAVREGHAIAAAPTMRRGVMGRLGRACLYASLALAGTSAGVLAASQSSLPGDPLYGMKLRIDELRIEAAPMGLRTALAEYVVESRLNEALVLATNGEWDRAALAAAQVERSVEQLAGLMGANDVVEERIGRHLAVLSGLIETAPAAAREALAHAVAVSAAALETPTSTGAQGAHGGPGSGGSGSSGNGPSRTPPATAAATATEPTEPPASLADGETGDGGSNGSGGGNGGSGPAASAAPSAPPTPSAKPTPSTGPRSSHASDD